METYNPKPVKYGTTFKGYSLTIKVNGSAIDLTNATVTKKLKKSPGSPLIKTWSSPSGLLITLPNIITFPEQIITVAPGVYKYEIKIEFADGKKSIYVGGEWEIEQVINN